MTVYCRVIYPALGNSGVGGSPGRAVAKQDGGRKDMQSQALKRERSARELLVDATIESVHRYGLSDTSVATVTEIAGLSRGMVRHCFSSKNAMLIAAYQSLRVEWSRNFFAAQGESAFETVIRMVESMFCPPNLEPIKVTAWMAFTVACLHDKELNRICREDNAMWRDAISAELRAHAEQTGLQVDADRVADTVLAAADGLWLRYRIEPERMTPEMARDLIVQLVQDLVPRP